MQMKFKNYDFCQRLMISYVDTMIKSSMCFANIFMYNTYK
jgi:hypothetical protein